MKKKVSRDSGIEFLKILAIIIIVTSHVVQTLCSGNQPYSIDITKATTNLQYIILLIFRHFGGWGNALFFVCSAWFLLKSNTVNKKKWLFMYIEIWVVSIIILISTYVILHGEISKKIIIRSILPTIYNNNWYMTCYLVFYPIHSMLNVIIKHMRQTILFRSSIYLAFLYIGFNFVFGGGMFFTSNLILWITIYFVIAYIQYFCMDFVCNLKANIQLLVFNIICFVGIIALTEFMGLHFTSLSNKMMYWDNNCNPFLIGMSIAMFNIAQNIHFTNRIVNYISSLSSLIYIIHENLIIRTYFRPKLWNYIYSNYGYHYILGWVFIAVVVVFLFGTILAILYELTIRKFVSLLSNKIYQFLKIKYICVEKKILKIT